LASNRAFHKWLIDGIPVSYKKQASDDEQVEDRAFLIDFNAPERNCFRVVNQFAITGTKCVRRPDVIAFINGLPLVVIELKNPANVNTDIWDAFEQLQTYKDEI